MKAIDPVVKKITNMKSFISGLLSLKNLTNNSDIAIANAIVKII
jgi:hypothetical protein